MHSRVKLSTECNNSSCLQYTHSITCVIVCVIEVMPYAMQGPVFQNSWECLGLKGQLSNCNLLVLKNWSLNNYWTIIVFNVRKAKKIAKFDGLEPQRCEGIKGIVLPKIGSKSSGTFEKQAPGVFHLLSQLLCCFHATKVTCEGKEVRLVKTMWQPRYWKFLG